jgi:hypothetical protein
MDHASRPSKGQVRGLPDILLLALAAKSATSLRIMFQRLPHLGMRLQEGVQNPEV